MNWMNGEECIDAPCRLLRPYQICIHFGTPPKYNKKCVNLQKRLRIFYAKKYTTASCVVVTNIRYGYDYWSTCRAQLNSNPIRNIKIVRQVFVRIRPFIKLKMFSAFWYQFSYQSVYLNKTLFILKDTYIKLSGAHHCRQWGCQVIDIYRPVCLSSSLNLKQLIGLLGLLRFKIGTMTFVVEKWCQFNLFQDAMRAKANFNVFEVSYYIT